MRQIIDALTTAGLSENQATIYITLLQLKEGTAYKIAKHSGVKKPTTYLLLEELRSKGLVLKTPSETGNIYQPKSPEEFITSTKQTFADALRVLPQLKNLFETKNDDINVFFFEEKNGIKDALFYEIDKLRDKKLYGFYANYSKNFEILEPIYDQWTKKLEELNTSIVGITPEDDRTREKNQEHENALKNVTFVDANEYASYISIEATDWFIRIIDIKNLNAVIIKNTEVAKTMKQIFELVSRQLRVDT